MKEIVLKHSDEIRNLLGIVEIASKFAPSPINTISELFFGQIRNYLGELEGQRINKAIKRILLGLDKDIQEGKKFNPKIINLEQTDHRQPVTQELFEQVLRKCKDEPEEKKQVFISNIYRNLVTRSTKELLTANWGHKTIHIAEKMTYQQLILFRWLNYWTPHILFMPEKKDENRMLENYGHDNVTTQGGSNYTLTRSSKRTKKYDYILTYEDYISLFRQGFKTNHLNKNDQRYNPDRIILIDAYQHLKNLGLIEQHNRMKFLREERGINPKYQDEFPCEFIPTIAGTHVLNLLFHEDDIIQIPSLKQDIKDLEDIIIDPKMAKELGGKYNRIA